MRFDKAWNDYLAAEENILNHQLSLKIKTAFAHKCPFCDEKLLFLNWKKRKFERLYRKTQNIDLKAELDLSTKIFFVKFLEKRESFINDVCYGKCTRQKYTLLKALLGKEEQILPKCEDNEILATDFSKFFISKIVNIFASIQTVECPVIFPLTNKNLSPSLSYPQAT